MSLQEQSKSRLNEVYNKMKERYGSTRQSLKNWPRNVSFTQTVQGSKNIHGRRRNRVFGEAQQNSKRRLSYPFSRVSRVSMTEEKIDPADTGLLEFVRYEYPEMTKHTLESMVTPSASLKAGKQASMEVPFHPLGFGINLWKVVLSILSIYLGFYIPLKSAFWELDEPSLSNLQSLAATGLSLDLVLNFLTGYKNKRGLLELGWKDVVPRYLTGWFFFDFSAAVAACYFSLNPPAIPVGHTVEVRSIGNLIYVNDLIVIHVVKQVIFQNMGFKTLHSHSMKLVIWFVQISMLFLLALHWVTIWFYFVTQDKESTWYDSMPKEAAETVSTVYTVYFAGAFSILTGKQGPLTTTQERWFGFLCNVLGLFFQAYMLGEVTLLLQKFGARKTKWRIALDELNDSMQNMKLDPLLQERVKNAFGFWWAIHGSQNRTHEWLWTISKELRTEVLLEVNKTLLDKVPLFKDASEEFLIAITQALTTELFLPGGYVLLFGEHGQEMFFVAQGTLRAFDEFETVVYAILSPGAFFGEIALLDPLAKRTATVRSFTYSQVSILHRDSLDEVMKMFPDATELQGLQEAAIARQENTKMINEFKKKKKLSRKVSHK